MVCSHKTVFCYELQSLQVKSNKNNNIPHVYLPTYIHTVSHMVIKEKTVLPPDLKQDYLYQRCEQFIVQIYS